MAYTTWRRELEGALARRGDTLIANTLTGEQMDVEFNDGHGAEVGRPFTAWSETRVYFPHEYDGAQWVVSVQRHPA